MRRLWRASGHSLAGLRTAWRGEAAFRLEIMFAAVMLPAAFYVGRDTIERLLLIACIALVLVAELLNSAIEATIDRIGTDRHPLSGNAKDLASAAVMVSLCFTLVVWITLIVQRLSH